MKRLINRIKGFDPRRMIKMINVIKKRSHHSFIWIFLDIFRCFIKFGSGYMDYYLFYFEDLTDEEKATYINISVNKDYIRHCNDSSFYHIFNNKVEFLKTYKDFIKRDYIYLDECSYEDYLTFVNNHDEFMAKPVDGLCGYGIELIKTNEEDPKSLYDRLNDHGQLLLEERIKQNDSVSAIYPHSINTIRIVTLNNNDNVSILFSAMRIGNEGKVVDNFNNSGMFSVIDEDGVIRKPALDKNNEVYYEHPMTHTKIAGFKVPRYNDIINLVTKMAKVTPEVGIVGWDIAITDKGLDVVEGNEIPGYDIYQSREHLLPSKCGIKERFDNAIYPERKGLKIFAKGYNFIKFVWILFVGIVLDLLFNLLQFDPIPFTFYLPIAYIFYKHIDTRKFYKTVLLSCLVGVCIFIFLYSFAYYMTSPFESNYFEAMIRVPLDMLYLLGYYVLKSLVCSIINLYFIYPLFDKLIEKLNYKIGVIVTILVTTFCICFLLILFVPLFFYIFL